MKKKLGFIIGSSILLFFSGIKSYAQKDWNEIDRSNMVSEDTISRKGFTLVFLNKDADLDGRVKQRLIDAFFIVYPSESEAYNKSTARKVIFFLDPEYKGVAATAGNIVRFNPKWFHENPEDIDVVTHEVMHIIQSYPNGTGPGWLTEGIADYVRFVFGVNNENANWTLTGFSPKQNYKNAYRITARFLVWLDENKLKGIVRQLDTAMRSRKYNPQIWKELTGKTIDELWSEYALNPTI
jgi:hypothetical protein